MKRVKNTLILVGIIYIVHLINVATDYSLNQFGIFPRTVKGSVGIFTSPLLHGNFQHLFSNTIPLLVLLFLLFSFNEKKAIFVIIYTIIIGNLLVWLLGRNAIHIGASGLIYSLAAFLITYGFIMNKMMSGIVDFSRYAIGQNSPMVFRSDNFEMILDLIWLKSL